MKKNREKEIKTLLGRMTLAEKLGQLNQLGGSIYGRVDERGFADMIARGEVGSFLSSVGAAKLNRLQRVAVEKSRLGIPLLFAADVIHGIRTIFPTPLAESCSFDPECARATAEAAADEASALGIRWTFAPMVDVARDCRWGRIIEGAGEDPYLGGLFAAARVRGFQGEGESVDDRHVAACVKHFAAYGAAESGRDYNTVQLSDYNLYNTYLPPYYEGVRAGALGVMTAFNDLNGVPCSANPFLTRTILREGWGFRGAVISDWQSISETVAHRYCTDARDSAAEGLNAGISIDMAAEVYIRYGEELVRSGAVDISVVDAAVADVLRLKYAVGLMDNPYTDESREREGMTRAAYQTALRSAERSIVLLKNDGLLPLKAGARVLLVGALADDRAEMHGAWAARDTAEKTVSIVEGLRACFEVTYRRGYDLDGFCPDFNQALREAPSYDAVLACVGESLFESGEASSKTDVALRPVHREAVTRLFERNPRVAALLVNGRPLDLTGITEKTASILECWQLGTAAGEAVANVVSGKKDPEGRLTTTFPRATGQCPVYYGRFATGRPYNEKDEYTSRYLGVADRGLFNFGYGLSYTAFRYQNVRLACDNGRASDTVSVRLTVVNTGAREGTDTVQVYYAPEFSKPIRPELQLGAFRKVTLKPGESAELEIEMPVERMGVYESPAFTLCVAPGRYEIAVGAASDDIAARLSYTVRE